MQPLENSMNRNPAAPDGREPQLPTFPKGRTSLVSPETNFADPVSQLFTRLNGELGFRHQQTALRWLLEQLETSYDLRRLIHLLLQEGEA
jgi:hypothetical protein